MEFTYMRPMRDMVDNFKETLENKSEVIKTLSPTLQSIGNNVLQLVIDDMYSETHAIEDISEIIIVDTITFNENYPKVKNKGMIEIECSGTIKYKDKNNDIQKYKSLLRKSIDNYLLMLFNFAKSINIVIFSNPIFGSLEDEYWRQDFSINISIIF